MDARPRIRRTALALRAAAFSVSALLGASFASGCSSGVSPSGCGAGNCGAPVSCVAPSTKSYQACCTASSCCYRFADGKDIDCGGTDCAIAMDGGVSASQLALNYCNQ
jgi:hypothetical protein